MFCRLALVCLLVPLAAAHSAEVEAFAQTHYRLLKQIPIDGDEGWDHLSLDGEARRLYVAHTTEVVIIDIDKMNVIGEITGTPGVHGFAVAPELGLGFSSNGRESKAGIVDLKSLKTISRVDTGENPDAIVYVPARQEVYAFNGRSNSATVFAAASGTVVATIRLPGRPESAVLDPRAGRIYNNIGDKNVVVAIDVATHKLVSAWPITPGQGATGMAIDLDHHRLFLGCTNRLMVSMDSVSGRVVATVPVGQGVDGTAYDPVTRLVFSSNGDGTVTIVRQDTPDTLTVVQTLETARNARTMALDPKTHIIYLAAADYAVLGNQGSSSLRQRPAMVPGSFKILVYGPK